MQRLRENTTIQPQGLRLGLVESPVQVDMGVKVGDMQPPQVMGYPTPSRQTSQAPSMRSVEWPEGSNRPPDKLLPEHTRCYKGLLDQPVNPEPIHDDSQRCEDGMSTSRRTNGETRGTYPGSDYNVVNRNAGWPELSSRTTQLFTPDYSDIMDLNSSIEGWTDEMMPQQACRGPITGGGDRPNMLDTPFHAAGATAPSRAQGASTESGTSSTPSSPHQAARSNGRGLNENFELMLECVQAVGSDSFDSLVITYYTEKFGASTPLANEQRLSRNRGLPKLISEVYQATNDWSDWERRGFHEEILKTTESILMSEAGRARQAFKTGLSPLLAGQDWPEGAAESPSMVMMKRMIEDEVST